MGYDFQRNESLKSNYNVVILGQLRLYTLAPVQRPLKCKRNVSLLLPNVRTTYGLHDKGIYGDFVALCVTFANHVIFERTQCISQRIMTTASVMMTV